MQSVIDFFTSNSVVILSVLLALSEGLALIPSVKSNSIFQAIYGFLKKAVEKK